MSGVKQPEGQTEEAGPSQADVDQVIQQLLNQAIKPTTATPQLAPMPAPESPPKKPSVSGDLPNSELSKDSKHTEGQQVAEVIEEKMAEVISQTEGQSAGEDTDYDPNKNYFLEYALRPDTLGADERESFSKAQRYVERYYLDKEVIVCAFSCR